MATLTTDETDDAEFVLLDESWYTEDVWDFCKAASILLRRKEDMLT